MNRLKKLLALGVSVFTAASLAACGSSASGLTSKLTADYDDGLYEDELYDDSDYDLAAAETAAESEEYDYETSGSTGDENNFVIESDQKLVYTCDIGMETTGFDDTLKAVKDLISKYEGFIESESRSDSADDWYYSEYTKTGGTITETLTIRIPTEHYDEFMNDLEGNGKIRRKSQQVENITKAYKNTETTIATLQEEEKRLLEMMDQCETIEEMITVEDRLSQVENELAMYQSSLNEMDLDVDYSTVNLTIEEVLEYTPDEEPVYTSTFGQRLMNTIQNSWDNFTDFLENFLFFNIYAFPILLVLCAVFSAIFFPIRASVRRKNRRKKAAEEVKETEAKAE